MVNYNAHWHLLVGDLFSWLPSRIISWLRASLQIGVSLLFVIVEILFMWNFICFSQLCHKRHQSENGHSELWDVRSLRPMRLHLRHLKELQKTFVPKGTQWWNLHLLVLLLLKCDQRKPLSILCGSWHNGNEPSWQQRTHRGMASQGLAFLLMEEQWDF